MEFKDAFTEIKADPDGGFLEGHAAVFDVVDSDSDVIEKGAFADTIAERFPKNLVKVLWNHRDLIGKPTVLEEDSTGLYFKARVSPTSLGKDVLALVRDGVVDRMSFGFSRELWERDETPEAQAKWGRPVTRLRKLKLYEVSPVIFPANDSTDVAVAAKELGRLVGADFAEKLLDVLGKLTDVLKSIESKSAAPAPALPDPILPQSPASEAETKAARDIQSLANEVEPAVMQAALSLLQQERNGWGRMLLAANGGL